MSPLLEGISFFSLLFAAFGFVILLPLELFRYWKHRKLSWQTISEMLANTSILLPVILLEGLVLAFIGALFGIASFLSPWTLPINVWTVITAFLFVDFLYYLEHRISHRFRLYWAISHSVHHSSPQFDQTVGLRVSFIDGFLSPWFFLPPILLGFDPVLIGVCFTFILAYQQWLHTETIGKLGWLDRYLNTPSNHRVHHGTQPKYLDKNYGAVLMVWDHLFGTYQKEEEAPFYGLSKPIASKNPINIHLIGIYRLYNDLKRQSNWADRMKTFWYMPSWKKVKK